MKKIKILIVSCICIVVLLVSSVSFTQVDPEKQKLIDLPKLSFEEQQLRILYPNTSFKYRGVVTGDMATGDAAHELLVDFGSLGVWFLGGYSGSFVSKSPDNPDFLIGVDFGGTGMEGLQVLGDFGSKGLWFYDYDPYGGTWYPLSPDNAYYAIAVDDDDDGNDEIHVFFGASLGMWRYDHDTTTWTFMTGDYVSGGVHSDYWSVGCEETCWDFGSIGLWSCWWYAGSYTKWILMTGDNPGDDMAAADFGAGGSEEEVAVDFDYTGIWVYNNVGGSPSWNWITSDSPYDLRTVRFVGDSGYELVAGFNFVNGLWLWDYTSGYPGTWTMLSPDNPTCDEAFCEPFDPNGTTETSGDEELAVDFGGTLGLWQYNSNAATKWTKLSSDSPRFMVKADLYGDGVDNCLICDFSSLGLWYYYGKNGTWHHISADSPDP